MGDAKLVQNEHDREEYDFGEDMEVDWLIYTSISDDDDNDLLIWHFELEFVELDVGEGVMPTTEFREKLMDSENEWFQWQLRWSCPSTGGWMGWVVDLYVVY